MKKCILLLFFIGSAISISAQNSIKVDQFGYLPNSEKVAVISKPITGFNAPSVFNPSVAANQYQVRKASDNSVVFSGTITPWNAGATDVQSGDKVWWFDFSSVTTPDEYYIHDLSNAINSDIFRIDTSVYDNVQDACLQYFYYARCGVSKLAAHAGVNWADAACHIHSGNQDLQSRLYSSQTDVTTNKDLSGGWHDAGDYNKYTNLTWEAVTNLLMAYLEKPSVWTDNTNIPESGNNIPDILDHVKYELDWLLKMQQSNGSVLSVVGTQNFATASPASADLAQRLYGPATTSASFTAASNFALASKVLSVFPSLATYSATLQTAAISAYNWAVANPNITFYNSGIIAAGENETDLYGTTSRQFAAAVYLYALTGNATYKTYVDANYLNIHAYQWTYWYQFEMPQQDALMYYATLTGTNLPTLLVANNIKSNFETSISTNNPESLPAYLNNTAAYRSFMNTNNYTWNSHNFIADNGSLLYMPVLHNLNSSNIPNYRKAAENYLHYFHGVNPQNLTYLSNMSSFGAEHSLTEIYHSWFTDGSVWDKTGTSLYGPPPGIATGGVNPSYALDACCATNSCGAANAQCVVGSVTPPLSQPALKSYKDWNSNWPQNSWTITEVAIYTQAAYLRLLSKYTNQTNFTPLHINQNIKNNNIPKANSKIEIVLSPNPAYDFLIASLFTKHDILFTYEIYNTIGNTFIKSDVVFTNNKSSVEIPIKNLAPGIYYIRFYNNYGQQIIRLFTKFS
jgi:endoglucanase